MRFRSATSGDEKRPGAYGTRARARVARMALVACAIIPALAACAHGGVHVQPTGPDAGLRIVQIPLRLSDAYLVRGPGGRTILIDPGSATRRDSARLARTLAAEGLGFRDLALIVLTHGHADHSGGAAVARRASGAMVVAGRGDSVMLANGRNDALHAMGMEAHMIRLILPGRYPPVHPDLWIARTPRDSGSTDPDSLDLRPYGIPGRIVRTPGHTPGSIAVLLDTGDAIAGDLLRGGLLGGRIAPHHAAVHYFHADRAAAGAQICALLARGVTRFYVGHGGPLDRASVEHRFGRSCAAPPAAR